jgi:hypothetical protein
LYIFFIKERGGRYMADHDKAEKRAMKMKKLFQKKYYDPIMAALNSNPKDKQAFDNTMDDAGFVQAEKDWLWNYLVKCNKTGFGGWCKGRPGDPEWLPEAEAAASSGW